jgi:hypothetical protein
MAVELHVFFHGKLPTKSALNTAMKELGFPVTIKPVRGSIEKQSGFMPMLLRRDVAGVEFDVFEGRANIDESGVDDVDPSYDRTASFRWGGDENEMLCGLCAAAALAKLVNGVVFDEENLMSTGAAIDVARKALGEPEKSKGKREPGTRPADIKRYVKPLLELRSDLVLIDRLLLIRPVRHVLRGALLDRTSDKYSFRIWRYIKPLFSGNGSSLGYGGDVHRALWQVWQPHFQPLLFDVFQKDIFEQVGNLTTFDNFANELADTDRFMETRVIALVLAGQPERAAEYIREIERSDPDFAWLDDYREYLARDISAVCAEFHDREAKAAKELKLGDIWEPSPFPAELPPEKRDQVAEPLFVPTPWIARPPGLLEEAPERAGEVHFAKDTFERNGRIYLLAPLTADEAKERHREGEDYTLVTRLAPNLLLVLDRVTWWDRNQPNPTDAVLKKSRPSQWENIYLWFYSSSHLVWTRFGESVHGGPPHFSSVNVRVRTPHRSLWNCHFDFLESTKSIHDSRSGNRIYTNTPLTSVDIELAACPMPAFGEFEELARRLQALLRTAGYGGFP